MEAFFVEVFILSGFTGSGKTTFLNRFLPYCEGETVVIENENGEVKPCIEDAKGFAKLEWLPSGCVCCGMSLEFIQLVKKVMKESHPDQIILELSGTGSLSEVEKLCKKLLPSYQIKKITIVDASILAECLEDFGEFYKNQIENADFIFVNFQEESDSGSVLKQLREYNSKAEIYEEDFELVINRLLSKNHNKKIFAKNRIS
jgi:G3E family GTPase